MKRHITLIAIICAVTALATVYAQEDATAWLTDFNKAKKEASEKKMPILADFSGSDWCGWCKKLDNDVFSKKEFKDFAKDNLILFLADFPRKKAQDEKIKTQNHALMKKYSIRGFPTVLILDAEGKVLATTGYVEGGAIAYVEHLKRLISGAKKD